MFEPLDLIARLVAVTHQADIARAMQAKKAEQAKTPEQTADEGATEATAKNVEG